MTTRTKTRRRVAGAGVAGLLLAAGLVGAPAPAAASHDGPPAFDGAAGLPFVDMTSPTAGGMPMRIYGSGFGGTSKVSFGGNCNKAGGTTYSCPVADSPNIKVVSSTLLLAVTPPGPKDVVGQPDNNTFVDVSVTDDEGTVTSSGNFLYSDATFEVSPNTGLVNGQTVTFTVRGWSANTTFATAEANNLVAFAEPRPAELPPRYVDPIANSSGGPTFTTDSLGNVDTTVTVSSGDSFNGDGKSADPNAACPPNQLTADYGLYYCSLAASQFGRGVLGFPISFAGSTPDPTPASPTLAASAASAAVGQRVTLTGTKWNGAPFFGSSTSPSAPGENRLEIKLCGLGGSANSCSTTVGTGSVPLTRYSDPTPTSVGGEAFTQGATLQNASLTVGGDAAGCTTCFIRVRQDVRRPSRLGGQGGDAFNRLGGGAGFIEATVPLTVSSGTITHTVADFNGDGDTERSVYRGGAWWVEGMTTVYLGNSTDIPVAADYDGNGDTERAVYRGGAWYVEGQSPVYFGLSSDIPVPADYTGDGKADKAVFRPSNGGWYIQGQTTVYFGLSTDIPVPADYTGDGKAERAVWRPGNGGWYVEGQATVYFGLSTDIPVPGDYTGDGKADRAAWRPGNGGWYVTGQSTVYFGRNGDVPSPGRYDTDATTDRAVWRPSNGGWYVTGQSTVYFGKSGDIPLPLPQAIYRFFF